MKPQAGDYVWNNKLTKDQIQAFIEDCVAAGMRDEGDSFESDITRVGQHALWVGGQAASYIIGTPEAIERDVTDWYMTSAKKSIDVELVETDQGYALIGHQPNSDDPCDGHSLHTVAETHPWGGGTTLAHMDIDVATLLECCEAPEGFQQLPQPAKVCAFDHELLANLDYLMGQVDPVCWPNKRLARETHQKIRTILNTTKGEDQ